MKRLLFLPILFLGMIFVFAQIPEKMSYQAVIRNSSGQLIPNQNVAIKVSVLQTFGTGLVVVYSERLTGITNVNGLLSMEIGAGTVISGTFNTINWSSGAYFLKTEVDPTGGTNYTITGTSQLLSVPFAMYAKSSGNSYWEITGNNISNVNLGNVGIGLSIPTAKLDVAGKTKTSDLQVVNSAATGKVLTSDATGNATWKALPALHFRANLVNGSKTVGYNSLTSIKWAVADSSEFPTTPTGYNPATGAYTISESGYYSLFFKVLSNFGTGNVSGNFNVAIAVNGGIEAIDGVNVPQFQGVNGGVNVQTEILLSQGDQITFLVNQTYNNSGPITLGNLTQCGIHLIHK
ncbi:hypothetical protein [Chryseobacterium scophthalmum]|uniref:hypothetical protein n=1 Tax=Chryseobacterium scophthalmum TaxID=59733 RepID=UPI003CFD3669